MQCNSNFDFCPVTAPRAFLLTVMTQIKVLSSGAAIIALKCLRWDNVWSFMEC